MKIPDLEIRQKVIESLGLEKLISEFSSLGSRFVVEEMTQVKESDWDSILQNNLPKSLNRTLARVSIGIRETADLPDIDHLYVLFSVAQRIGTEYESHLKNLDNNQDTTVPTTIRKITRNFMRGLEERMSISEERSEPLLQPAEA